MAYWSKGSEGARPDRGSHPELGNLGDYKVLGHGVCELRVDFGPGYQIYFAREGRIVYLLLCGGDKSTQKADIKRAMTLWAEISKEQP